MLTKTAHYDLSIQGHRLQVIAHGIWTIESAASINDELERDYHAATYEAIDYHLDGVEDLDTAGAYLLTKAMRVGDDVKDWKLVGGTAAQQTLLSVAADAQMGEPPVVPRQWHETMDRLGRATIRFWDEFYATLAFFGQFFAMSFRVLLNPKRLRFKSIIALMEEIGLDAAPIVAILSFRDWGCHRLYGREFTRRAWFLCFHGRPCRFFHAAGIGCSDHGNPHCRSFGVGVHGTDRRDEDAPGN